MPCKRLAIWNVALSICAAVAGTLAMAPGEAAFASLPANGPTPEKAYAIESACSRLQLTPSDSGVQAAATADRPDRLWILETAEAGGVRLRHHARRDYLTEAAGALRLQPQAGEALTFSVQRLEGGRVGLRAADGRRLAIDGRGARLEPVSQSCAQALEVDAFPVYAPFARTLHVNASAPPDGDGSAERPFQSIQAALDQAGPGVRVLVAPGRYTAGIRIPKERSGTRGAWLVLQSAVTHGALLEAPGETATVHIDAAFVELHGFEVINASKEACIGGEGDDLRIIENFAHDCGGGGIALSRGANYHVEGNLVARTAYRNQWQMSGISIYQAPGDSCSQWCNVIRRNVSFGNDNRVPTWGNGEPTDGNGIILDDFANTQLKSRHGAYRGRTLVEHNLAYGNGGSGIRITLSDGITVRYNTTFRNHLREDSGTWRGEIMNVYGRDNVIARNVAVADFAAHRHNASLFDSGTSPARKRIAKALWQDNLVGAWPSDRAAVVRVAAGPPLADAVAEISAPVFKRPELSLDADLSLISLPKGAPGAAGPPAFGADFALTPTPP